jgi:hypothetical protein
VRIRVRMTPPVLVLVSAVAVAAFTGGCASAGARDDGISCSLHRSGLMAQVGQAAAEHHGATERDEQARVPGTIPLVLLSQRPSSDRDAVPRFELAVFEDGRVVYVGRSCVAEAGAREARLTAWQLAAVRDLVAAQPEFDVRSARASLPEEEVCIERATVRELVVSDAGGVHAATDRCRAGGQETVSLGGLADELIDRAGVRGWVGRPVDWKACPIMPPALRGALPRSRLRRGGGGCGGRARRRRRRRGSRRRGWRGG